jgi:hypothetical protein
MSCVCVHVFMCQSISNMEYYDLKIILRTYVFMTKWHKSNRHDCFESTYGNMWRNPPKGRNPAGHLSRFELLSRFFNSNVFYVRHTTLLNEEEVQRKLMKYFFAGLDDVGRRWAVENCMLYTVLIWNIVLKFQTIEPAGLLRATFVFWDGSIRRITRINLNRCD